VLVVGSQLQQAEGRIARVVVRLNEENSHFAALRRTILSGPTDSISTSPRSCITATYLLIVVLESPVFSARAAMCNPAGFRFSAVLMLSSASTSTIGSTGQRRLADPNSDVDYQ